MQAYLHQGELDAWLEGNYSPDSCTGLDLNPQHRSPTLQQHELRLVTLFSLNDYLGLSTHSAVRAAAAAAAMQVGSGPRSSALVAGFTTEHRQLELELAALKGTQDALLAGSTAGAVQLVVYRHNDLAHLRQLLDSVPAAARKLVVTDSLFSMDGDFADLRGLAALRQLYGFVLVVDDAHGTLVCGCQGGGAAEMMGVAEHIDVHVGTLSKAAGGQGGFAACSSSMRQLLLNRGRSVVFSTALPVPVVAAARAALRVARSEGWRRQHVWSLTRLVSEALGVPAASPIIPLVVGSEEAALALSRQLLQQGYHVPAIRPPTVPAGTSRLRISLSSGHTRAQ
eukprot:gene14116-14245_t